MKKKTIIILTAVLVSFGIYSCARESGVSAIRLNIDEVVMREGKDTLVIATVEPSGYSGQVLWESMNPDVASVGQDGRVTAIGGGRTFVLAKAGGVSKGCAVTVRTDIKSISFVVDNLFLAEKGSETLTFVTEPAEVFMTKLLWESSDKEVVVVADGRVSAKGLGQATVSVCSEDNPAVRASIDVIVVKQIPKITLSPTLAFMFDKPTLQLSATLSPADCECSEIKWYSTDPEVATVDQTGLVTSGKTGDAKIVVEATIVAGTVTRTIMAECNLKVRSPFADQEVDESVEGLQPGTGYDGWTDVVK